MTQELTWRQKVFCRAYITNGMNATQAAITAGYSKDTAAEMGYENLNKPHIKAFIDKKMEQLETELEEKFNITFEEKAKLLWECAQDCKEGKATKEGYMNASGLVSAVAELNKMQGHYKDKEHVEEKLDDMSKKLDELKAQYKKDY